MEGFTSTWRRPVAAFGIHGRDVKLTKRYQGTYNLKHFRPEIFMVTTYN
jgi:hypothetical protein